MSTKKIISAINQVRIPWRVWIALWVIALLSPISIKLLLKPTKTTAWWNDNWLYRNQVTITNNESFSLTNFQVSFTVNTQSLINQGKMRSDCADVKIISSTDTELDHYVENCGQTQSRIWVKPASLPAGNTTLYMYYGNTTATYISSGESIFEFIDTFSHNSINNYTWTPSNASVNWEWNQENNWIDIVTGDNNHINISKSLDQLPESGRLILGFIKRGDYPTDNNTDVILENSTTSDYYLCKFSGSGYSDQGVYKYVSGSATDSVSQSGTVNTDHDHFFTDCYWSANSIRLDINGSEERTINPTNNTTNIAPDNFLLRFSQLDLSFKYIFVVKDTPNKPTSSVSGQETHPSRGTTKPIGYWKLDEQQGQTTYEHSGSYHGTLGATSTTGSDDPSWKTQSNCHQNGCLSFDAADDHIRTSLNSNLSAYTISAWIKPNDLPATNSKYEIMGKRGSHGVALHNNGSTQSFIIYHWGDDCNVNYTVTPDVWTHVAVSYANSESEKKLFINGKYIGSCSGSGNPSTSSNYYWIGGRESPTGTVDDDFNGLIDEVKIFDYTRSEEQIKVDYNSSTAVTHGSRSNEADTLNNGAGNPPIAEWLLNENTGSSTFDTSENEHTGTLNNNPQWTQGYSGSALAFDGESTNVSVSNSSDFNIGTAVTYEAWVYPTNASTGYIINKWVSGQENKELAVLSDLKVQFSLMNALASPLVSNASLPQNQWSHIAGVYDGSNTYLYINGKVDVQTSASGDVANDSGTVYLGFNPDRQSTGNYAFQGKIDQVRIYDYARSSDQIQYNFNRAKATFHWKLNEGTGNTTHDSISDDATGTITGASWQPESECVLGKCLAFDNSGDYISIPDADNLDVSLFSISAWANWTTTPTGAENDFIISRGQDSSSATNYYLWVDGDGSVCGTSTTTVVYGFRNAANTSYNNHCYPFTPTADTWYHFEITHDGTTISLYLDGHLVDSESETELPYTGGSQKVLIGTDQWYSGFFNGKIDDVKISTFPKTKEQSSSNFNTDSSIAYGVLGVESEDIVDGSGNDPTGHWTFDEKNGSTAHDNTGNENSGSLGGGTPGYEPSWTIGKHGAALEFDGTDDYVDFDTWSSVQTNYTIEFWTLLTDSSSGSILQRGNSFGCFYNPRIESSGTSISVKESGCSDQGLIGSFSIDSGKWTHFTITRNGQTAKIYINGKLVTTDTSQPNPQSIVTGLFSAGANYSSDTGQMSSFFNGKIDDIKIYDYARTENQIAYDYNRGKPIAHWKLDECQGTSAHDSSTNNNTGTIHINSSGSQSSVGTCSTSGAWANGVNGKFNNSLSFDGTDDYIDVPDDDTLSFPNHDFSIAAWIYPTSINQMQTIISKVTSSSEKEYSIILKPGGTFRIDMERSAGDQGAELDMNIASANKWQHIIFTFDASSNTPTFYYNGKPYTVNSNINGYSTNLSNNLNIGRLGGSYNNNYFQGKIDDVRIYSYKLSQQQVNKIINEDATIRFGSTN